MASDPRSLWIAIGASALAGLALVWPVLALPAFLAVTLAFIALDGTPRQIVGLVGGPLMTVAIVRFVLGVAVPNIVIAGERAAEEKAVSRLREIRWAEEQARDLKWRDSNNDGQAEFVSLADLMTRGGPLLKPGLYTQIPDGAVRSEAYDFAVYLPASGSGWTSSDDRADPIRAARTFVVLAWPAGERRGGKRTFFIDQDDQICERVSSTQTTRSGPAPEPWMEGGKCPTTPVEEGGWGVWGKKRAKIPQR